MKVLVSGGAGYIGSVVVVALEEAGHVPLILDSLDVGAAAFTRGRIFYQGDVRDAAVYDRIVGEHPDLGSAIHLAALTVVPESVAQPERYFSVNVEGSRVLATSLAANGVHDLVFSSSAAVYAPAERFELDEDAPFGPTSPYAETKVAAEGVLREVAAAQSLRVVALRYFNPIGAEPGLRCGSPAADPSHVLGRLVAAARGRIPEFAITGTAFGTRDGTGLRDYVHVWDVARAHVAAIDALAGDVAEPAPGELLPLNVGTGAGTTVRELVAAFERVTGERVPVTEAPARPGDSAGGYANVDRARALLGWESELSVEDGIRSALAWDLRRADVLAGEDPSP